MLDYIIGSRIVFSFCNADHGVDNIVIAIGPLHHLIFAKMLSVTSKLIKRCKGSNTCTNTVFRPWFPCLQCK